MRFHLTAQVQEISNSYKKMWNNSSCCSSRSSSSLRIDSNYWTPIPRFSRCRIHRIVPFLSSRGDLELCSFPMTTQAGGSPCVRACAQ